MKILITPRSMTQHGLESVAELQPLRDAGYELVSATPGVLPTEAELLSLASDVVGWIAGVETISAEVLAAAKNLRVISRNGIGSEKIDMGAAAAHEVRICVARGANARGVAELALGLIFSCLRDIPRADSSLRSGEWIRRLGREMPDVTVGIVGYGAIGRLLGDFCSALGARVLTYDPFSSPPDGSAVIAASFETVFAESDVISLHTPPPADGSPLITAEVIDSMKEGAALINTARSALVDSTAVLSGLESKRLSTYAVDAFDSEPPALTPLLAHPHTILTPHLGGFTQASTRRATELAVANLLAKI